MRFIWDEYFMQIVDIVKEWLICFRRKVGVLIVKDKRIFVIGYNGVLIGFFYCEEVGCLREKLNVFLGQRYEFCRGFYVE